MTHIEGCPRPGCYVANCACQCHEPYTPWMRENNAAVQVPVVEQDTPAEHYWTDRTAALAEALHQSGCMAMGNFCPGATEDEQNAKDALLYLREHGWTLEREER